MDTERAASVQRKMMGARIRALRMRFGLSLEECAQALGLTSQGILQRELGCKPLMVGEFWRFCAYLGVAPEEAYRVGASPAARLPGARVLRLYRKMLGATLAEGRADKGWSQSQAAAKARITEERLRLAELGLEELTVGEVETLAALYGAPAAKLFAQTSEPPARKAAKTPSFGDSERKPLALPPDVAEFLGQPDAERYLRAAMAFSLLDEDSLAALEEALMFLSGSA